MSDYYLTIIEKKIIAYLSNAENRTIIEINQMLVKSGAIPNNVNGNNLQNNAEESLEKLGIITHNMKGRTELSCRGKIISATYALCINS